MTTMDCHDVLDRLPDRAAGRLEAAEAAAVDRHVAGCAACHAEWTVVGWLSTAGPPAVPAGLEARLREAVRAQAGVRVATRAPTGRWRMPTWGLAAAAGVVLALATPALVERMGDGPLAGADDPAVVEAVGEALPSPWIGDSDLVAGALMLDGLSDEALEQLLRELEG